MKHSLSLVVDAELVAGTGEGWGEGEKEVFSIDYIPLPVQPRRWVTYVPGSDPHYPLPPGEGKVVLGQPLNGDFNRGTKYQGFSVQVSALPVIFLFLGT